MTKYILPHEWAVGIASIDQEHQELFDMLFVTQLEESADAKTNTKYFVSFLNRVSILMGKRERHMEEHDYHSFSLQRKKEGRNKTIERLQDIRVNKPAMLQDACMSTLLREIADAELYYKSVK